MTIDTGASQVPKKRFRRVLAAATASAALALPCITLASSAASAETIAATTSCANPFTGAQAGPSSFTFTVPATIHPGDSVPVQLSFDFANTSGFSITDVNSFSMPGAAPVALTAGSQGAIANGASATVTLTGTWSPSATGAQTISASNWTFNTVAFGLTIPVTCTFTSAPPSVTRAVTPRPTLILASGATRPGRSVQVSGTNWTPSSPGTMSLCDSAAHCVLIGKVFTNRAGRLCASGRVPAGTAAGADHIQVTVGPDTETAAISILGPRRPRRASGHSPAHGQNRAPG
jgi:hypothetical protein